jgi:hypothetical protein
VTCPVLLLGGVGGSHRYWAGTTPSAAGDHVVTGDRLWLRAAAEATGADTRLAPTSTCSLRRRTALGSTNLGSSSVPGCAHPHLAKRQAKVLRSAP